MAKKRPAASEMVKLQIPVSEKLAADINEFAVKCDRSQAWIVRKLLQFAVDDDYRTKLSTWLGRRVAGKKSGQKQFGWRQMGSDSAVRLQANVPAETSAEIESLGQALNHTTVRMAALLLDFGMDVFTFDLRLGSWKPMRAVFENLFGVPEDSHPDREQ